MTFYNIIFGLLAVGAFREVIFALAQGPDWRLFCLAATLSLLAFSDAIFTALVVEGKKRSYTIDMKMLDLFSFVLLSFAVVIVNPCTNDMFEVDVVGVLRRLVVGTRLVPEALFWGLLAIYMFTLVIWNRIQSRHVPIMWRDQRWLRPVQPVLAAIFVGMAVLVVCTAGWGATFACECPKEFRAPSPFVWDRWPLVRDPSTFACVIAKPDRVLDVARGIVLVLVVLYLILYKRYMSKVLDRKVRLAKLESDHVNAIHDWPPYEAQGNEGKIQELDYALREHGWLEHFPESDTNARYGIWSCDELVGFSMLVDIKENDTAEFYIAIRNDCRGKGIGPDATAETVRLGLKKYKLKTITLKVRAWHLGAQKIYQRVGFKPGEYFSEDVNGQSGVRFLRMTFTSPKAPSKST